MLDAGTIQIWSALAQTISALVLLWYTIETFLLRSISEQNLRAQRKANRLSMMPVFLFSILPKEQIDSEAETKTEFPNAERLFCIENISNRIGLNCFAALYDATQKNFSVSDSGYEILKVEAQKRYMEVGTKYFSQKELSEWISRNCDVSADLVFPHLSHRKRSYIVMVYSDIEQNTYFSLREFEFDRDKKLTNYHESRQFCLSESTPLVEPGLIKKIQLLIRNRKR
jgi:hypothetical protein